MKKGGQAVYLLMDVPRLTTDEMNLDSGYMSGDKITRGIVDMLMERRHSGFNVLCALIPDDTPSGLSMRCWRAPAIIFRLLLPVLPAYHRSLFRRP